MPTQAWVHRARYLGPDRPQARRGAPRQGGPRAARDPGAAARPPRARPRRERVVEPHRHPRRDPARAQARDRRRDHDLAAELDPPRRRRGEARDRRPLGGRPARLRSSRTPTAAPRARPCARRRRSIVGVAKLVAALGRRRSSASSDFIADEVRALEPRGSVAHDRERLRLRRLRRARRTRPARGCGSRTPAASSASATRDRSCRRCTTPALDAVARFLGDFRSADREWAEGLGLGDRLELIPYAPRVDLARAAARLRGAAAADPRRGRPRQGRALGQGLRVPRRASGRSSPRCRPTARRPS